MGFGEEGEEGRGVFRKRVRRGGRVWGKRVRWKGGIWGGRRQRLLLLGKSFRSVLF